MHVAHITKPFTSRVRFAPEVASKPDRLAKDLANAKALAAVLEDEYESLRKLKIDPKAELPNPNGNDAQPNENDEHTDAPMVTADEVAEDDSEPRERGSEAVERRVEKIMADIIDQGLVDASDEKAVEAKRVSTL